MSRTPQLLGLTLIVSVAAASHAGEHQQHMRHDGYMPIVGPYMAPMYPMMQGHHPQHHPAQSAQQPTGETAPASAEKTLADMTKSHQCHHDKNHYKAMRDRQLQMQQHMQRMETHLANIERLIRQMVENR